MGLARHVQRLTVAAYLERERSAPFESEFFDSEVFAMAGGSPKHRLQIPTLREYLLLSATEPRVEQFLRQEGGPWLWREASGLKAVLAVPSLGFEVPLKELYANVRLKPMSLSSRMGRKS